MPADANGGPRIITPAPKDAIAFLSTAELLARYRSKVLSPVEVMRAVLDSHRSAQRRRQRTGRHVDAEGALRSARESEARRMADAPAGMIDGVPIGIKDNLLVAGMPARFGSKLVGRAVDA